MAITASNTERLSKNLITERFTPASAKEDNRIGYTLSDSAANNPGQDLLAQAESVASQQLTGAIPDDVQAEVMRISAENALQSGLGTGQAARNLTARDLGLTSIDIQKQGQTAASDLVKIRTQQKANNENFLIALQGQATNRDILRLQALELASQNQFQAQTLVNKLIIQNSIGKIKGLQSNINQLIGGGKGKDEQPGYITSTNRRIKDIIEGL